MNSKIILGIIIFLAAFTSPFWVNMFSSPVDHKVEMPKDYKECVMDTEYMKTSHMDLLNEWRDKVVREDIRFYKKDGNTVMLNGRKMEMSLTKTCLSCHSDKKEFCDKCHNYLEVTPYCWDCHVEEYKEPPVMHKTAPAAIPDTTEAASDSTLIIHDSTNAAVPQADTETEVTNEN